MQRNECEHYVLKYKLIYTGSNHSS